MAQLIKDYIAATVAGNVEKMEELMTSIKDVSKQ
jgi:hypothetical protein